MIKKWYKPALTHKARPVLGFLLGSSVSGRLRRSAKGERTGPSMFLREGVTEDQNELTKEVVMRSE